MTELRTKAAEAARKQRDMHDVALDRAVEAFSAARKKTVAEMTQPETQNGVSR